MRALALLLAGCAGASSGSSALERVELPFRPGRKVDRLLILIHEDPRSFETNGFLDELAERALQLDAVSVHSDQADFGRRLHDDLVFPKRQEGYRKIYVVGVSRGGAGAISFARRYAGEPDGLILIAPFLGADALVDEINAEGGLDRWRPKPPLDDVERCWQWLQGYGLGAPRPLLELMWGDADPASVQLTTVEEVLPPERVHRVSGGHDWKTWRKLWADLLDRDPYGWNEPTSTSTGSP
jgi:pimeloyl-ACP methyl ester carboxylesterase